MLAFLIAVLIFALGVGLSAKPTVIPTDVVNNFQDKISHVEKPKGNPIIPPPNLASQNSQPENKPDTILAAAYNNYGGIVIESIPAVAVEKSPALVSCSDEPKLCAEPEGPGNSQNAPVGPPDGGPVPHGGKPAQIPPQDTPSVGTPDQALNHAGTGQAENGLAKAQSARP